MFLYMLFEWIAAGGLVEGWLYRMVNLLLPVSIAMLITDIVMKYFVNSFKVIWIMESIIFLGVIYYWIIS